MSPGNFIWFEDTPNEAPLKPKGFKTERKFTLVSYFHSTLSNSVFLVCLILSSFVCFISDHSSLRKEMQRVIKKTKQKTPS